MNDYERGRWDMFVEITNADFGKQYYFLQDNGTVYSRHSCRYMNIEEAYHEYIHYCVEEGWSDA